MPSCAFRDCDNPTCHLCALARTSPPIRREDDTKKPRKAPKPA